MATVKCTKEPHKKPAPDLGDSVKPHLLVFSPLYPPHIGGLESHAHQWNQHLAQKNYQVTVFTPQVIKDSPKSEHPHPNLTIIRYPTWEIISNYPLPAIWKPAFWHSYNQHIKPILQKNQRLILVSRTRFFITTPMAFLVSHYYKKPWLHIEHGADHVQAQNPLVYHLARLFDLTIARILLPHAQKIVANSKASARFIKKISPTTKPIVLHRGVDIDAIHQINPEKIPPNKKEYRITYVGRLIDGKGIPDLLKSISQLKTPAAHLYIVGDGPLKKSLIQQIKQLDLAHQVTLLGTKTWSQTIAFIKSSDIIVNPSHSEGMPSTIIEAALCQKAIIATDVGGTPEIITHNSSALLYPAGDSKKLTHHLQTLLNNPQLRQKLAQNAYQATQNRFAWNSIIPHYENLVQKICKDPE